MEKGLAMTRSARAILGAFGGAAALAGAGCTYYVPATTVPVTQTVTTPANFDRSFNAALGALQDQGVTISRSDAAAGVIEGMRGDGHVTANLNRQADGSVRVQFNTSGGSDSTLADRITRSYQARMGR
jgi:hypothetical protein